MDRPLVRIPLPTAVLAALVVAGPVVGLTVGSGSAAAGSSVATAQFPTDPREAMEVYEAPVEDWDDGPVRYIMLEDEREIWGDLEDDLDRREFKKWFWLRRDDDTRDRQHPFMAGFYARVATANQRFPGVPRGWKTDRGRAWVVLGRPDNIRTSTGAIETWTYNTFGAMPAVSFAGELQIGFRRVEATKYYVVGGVGPGAWPPYVTEAMKTVNQAAIQDPTLEFEPWKGPRD